MYNSSLNKGTTFLWTSKRTVQFSLLQGSIWIWSIVNLRYYESPDSVIRPFPLLVCEGSTIALESWKVGAASRFGLNLPPTESIQPENLSPFNVCTQKCRRQRKWTTDENVEEDKQTAYKWVLTLITHLYAVLVSIHRRTIILHQMNIGQAVNFTPSKNIEEIYPLPFIRCLPLYSRFNACSISLRLYRTLPPST